MGARSVPMRREAAGPKKRVVLWRETPTPEHTRSRFGWTGKHPNAGRAEIKEAGRQIMGEFGLHVYF